MFHQLRSMEATASIRELERQIYASHYTAPPESYSVPPENDVLQTVRCEVEYSEAKAHSEREGWFHRNTLPPASVLARQSLYDRDALIEHFRAKELRQIADATYERRHYNAGLARKRLERVNEIGRAFAEVTGSAA